MTIISNSPSLADIDFLQDFSLDAEDNWEAAVQWLRDRRASSDINSFWIGWTAHDLDTRYGDKTVTKWAIEADFSPGTVGRMEWVASAWKVDEVRQAAEICPRFTFKMAEVLRTDKVKNGWTSTVDWLYQAADNNWSAAKLQKQMRGDDDETDKAGKPMRVHGTLMSVPMQLPDGTKGVLFGVLLSDEEGEGANERAEERGFAEAVVEMIIKLPKLED